MDQFFIERLPNGFIRLYDRRCDWACLYNPDGTYRHGAVNSERYHLAVAEWLAAH